MHGGSCPGLFHPQMFMINDINNEGEGLFSSQISRVSHLRISTNIMHINAKQVAQAMRHEDGTNVMLYHVIHISCQNTNLHQLLQVNPVSQTVHVSPFHTFTKKFFIICKTPEMRPLKSEHNETELEDNLV